MSDELAFRAALAANPADATARLVYADWLEEHSRPVDAALQRVLAQPDDDSRRLEYADAVGGERGEFVRVQVEAASLETYPDNRMPQRFPGEAWNDYEVRHHREKAQRKLRLAKLRRRERELWDGGVALSFLSDELPAVHMGGARRVDPPGCPVGLVRRGFVDEVAATAADWLNCGDDITAAHPVRAVRLATWPHQYRTLKGGGPVVGLADGYRVPPVGRDIPQYPAGKMGDPFPRVELLLEAAFPGIAFEFPH